MEITWCVLKNWMNRQSAKNYLLLKEISFQGNIFTPFGSTFVLIGQAWGRCEEIGTDTKKAIFSGNCYFPTKSFKSLRSAILSYVTPKLQNFSFLKFEIASSSTYLCQWVSQSVSQCIVSDFRDSYRIYRACELVKVWDCHIENHWLCQIKMVAW